MKAIRVYLPEDLEKKFRRISMESYGYSRGSLSKAAEDALRGWIRTREIVAHTPIPDDPVRAVRGLLRGVKKGSVELQHESTRIRAKRARG